MACQANGHFTACVASIHDVAGGLDGCLGVTDVNLQVPMPFAFECGFHDFGFFVAWIVGFHMGFARCCIDLFA